MYDDYRLEKITQNLYEFYKEVVCLDYPDFTEPPHIKELAGRLQALCRGEFNNLCVAMPPRHSKSSMVSLALPLWLVFNNPNLNILIVNAEASLSERFGIDLRDFIDDFSGLTGVYVSDVKHSSTHIKFEDEYGNLYKGSIKLVGASGGITGQDADYLIIDDPYKGFEDITPGLLNKKIEWFKAKIIQRREPHTKLIICHTRWHTDDLQGYLRETQPEQYQFLEFPAIKEDGTSLWSERYTIEFLKQQLKDMGERLFSSIYQQKPLDETGDFLNIDNINFIDSYDPRLNYPKGIVRSWDLAYSDESHGDANDSTAGVLMCRTIDDMYIIKGLEYGQYGDNLINTIKRTAYLDTPNTPILLETGTKGGAAEFLYKEYKQKLIGYNTHQSEPIGSKVDRATPFKNAILDGKVYVALADHERGLLLEQFKAFPLGKHDDIVDACSYAYNYLMNKGTSEIVTGGKRRRRNRL